MDADYSIQCKFVSICSDDLAYRYIFRMYCNGILLVLSSSYIASIVLD